MADTHNKRNEGQRERDLPVIAALYCKGYSYQTIAEKLNAQREYKVSRQQIYYDVTEIRKDWEESHQDKLNSYLVEQLQKIDKVESEAWEAWERSKAAFVEKTKTESSNEQGVFSSESKKTRKQYGDPALLATINKCIEQRTKLLGLVAERVKHEGEVGFTFNYVIPKDEQD